MSSTFCSSSVSRLHPWQVYVALYRSGTVVTYATVKIHHSTAAGLPKIGFNAFISSQFGRAAPRAAPLPRHATHHSWSASVTAPLDVLVNTLTLVLLKYSLSHSCSGIFFVYISSTRVLQRNVLLFVSTHFLFNRSIFQNFYKVCDRISIFMNIFTTYYFQFPLS